MQVQNYPFWEGVKANQGEPPPPPNFGPSPSADSLRARLSGRGDGLDQVGAVPVCRGFVHRASPAFQTGARRLMTLAKKFSV